MVEMRGMDLDPQGRRYFKQRDQQCSRITAAGEGNDDPIAWTTAGPLQAGSDSINDGHGGGEGT